MERIFAIIVGLAIGFSGSHAFLGQERLSDKLPPTVISRSVPIPQPIRTPQCQPLPQQREFSKPMGICNRFGRFVFGSHRTGDVGIFRRIGRFFFGRHR